MTRLPGRFTWWRRFPRRGQYRRRGRGPWHGLCKRPCVKFCVRVQGSMFVLPLTVLVRGGQLQVKVRALALFPIKLSKLSTM